MELIYHGLMPITKKWTFSTPNAFSIYVPFRCLMNSSDRFTFYEENEKKIQKGIIPRRQYTLPNKLKRENNFEETQVTISVHVELTCHKITCQGLKIT